MTPPAPFPMRVLFLVQGEGRGHLTQALALAPMLRRAGHEVVGTVVGLGAGRAVPRFFADELGGPVVPVAEPAFAYGPRGVAPLRTAAAALRQAGAVRRALGTLHTTLGRLRPDVVVNFYTVVGGLYGRRGFGVPVVCVGHQYAFHHPAYPFGPDQRAARAVLRAWTDRTVPPGARRLALSFYPADDLPARNARVVPPLLRDALRGLRTSDDGSLLVYLMHPARVADVAAWAARRPDVPVHVFTPRPGAPPEEAVGPTLTVHALDGARFLERMARSHAVVCTAGFESVCEARYLGKPVLMVPVRGHAEQTCNARDAEAVGAGLHRAAFDLDALLAYAARYRPDPAFRAWADAAEDVFVGEVERAAGVARRRGLRPAA